MTKLNYSHLLIAGVPDYAGEGEENGESQKDDENEEVSQRGNSREFLYQGAGFHPNQGMVQTDHFRRKQ